MIMKEKIEKLLAARQAAIDLDLEDNTVRIALINKAFQELKAEALSQDESLQKIFYVSKILSPTEGHWDALIIKAFFLPRNMSRHEIFEIGRFTERLVSYAALNDFNYLAINKFKQTLQHSL